MLGRMTRFSPEDIAQIDALWRAIPADHVWTGWSACGETPTEVIIYRTRAHWRKFPLRRTDEGFALFDEREREIARHTSLAGLLAQVESLPGLERVSP